MKTQEIGLASENLALQHLEQHGLKLLERNYSSRYGEIDLIMLDDETLVFIEVRYRRSNDYGDAFASITPSKQKHIHNTAQHFIQQNKKHAHRNARIDAIGIASDNGKDKINWIKNAFEGNAF